jgi:hypothetical protein
LLKEIERIKLGLDAEDAVKVPDDPVQFCVDWLGYTPFRYMWPFL